METNPPLKALYQADLDDASCAQLLSDIESYGGQLELSVKLSATGHVEPTSSWTLSQARAALEQRKVRAIQLRYAHADKLWTDTIFRTPAGFRLVRIEC